MNLSYPGLKSGTFQLDKLLGCHDLGIESRSGKSAGEKRGLYKTFKARQRNRLISKLGQML